MKIWAIARFSLRALFTVTLESEWLKTVQRFQNTGEGFRIISKANKYRCYSQLYITPMFPIQSLETQSSHSVSVKNTSHNNHNNFSSAIKALNAIPLTKTQRKMKSPISHPHVLPLYQHLDTSFSVRAIIGTFSISIPPSHAIDMCAPSYPYSYVQLSSYHLSMFVSRSPTIEK